MFSFLYFFRKINNLFFGVENTSTGEEILKGANERPREVVHKSPRCLAHPYTEAKAVPSFSGPSWRELTETLKHRRGKGTGRGGLPPLTSSLCVRHAGGDRSKHQRSLSSFLTVRYLKDRKVWCWSGSRTLSGCGPGA